MSMETLDYTLHEKTLSMANYDSEKEYYPDNYINLYYAPEEFIADGIMASVPPVLIVLGCIGNILIIAVMKNWTKNNLHYSQYLAVLAAVDTILLVAKLGNDWILYMWNVNVREGIRNKSDVACQLLSLGLRMLRYLSMWLVTALVFDRMVIMRDSQKLQSKSTNAYVLHSFLLLLLFTFLVNAHVFWTQGLTQQFDARFSQKVCSFLKQGGLYNRRFLHDIWPVLNETFGTFLPWLFIVACFLCASSAKQPFTDMGFVTFRNVHNNEQNSKCYSLRNTRRMGDIMTMVKICGLLSLVLSVPEAANNMYEFWTERNNSQCTGYDERRCYARKRLVQTLCYLVWDIFSAGKFFVLFITSKRFRQSVRLVLSDAYHWIKEVKCTDKCKW